ncbi:hypothetical protein ABG067_005805 [Albugo candida]
MTAKSHAVAAPAPINTPSLRKENQKKDGNLSNPSSGHVGWGVKSGKEEVSLDGEKEIHAERNGSYQQCNGRISSMSTVIPNANKSWNDLDGSPIQQKIQREEISSRSTQSVQSESSFSPTLCKQMSIMNITNWCDDPFEEETARFRPQVDKVTESFDGKKRTTGTSDLHEEANHTASRDDTLISDRAQQTGSISSDSRNETRQYPGSSTTPWRNNQLSESAFDSNDGIPPRPLRQHGSGHLEGSLVRSDEGNSFWAQDHSHQRMNRHQPSVENGGHINRRKEYNGQSRYYLDVPTNDGYSRQDLREDIIDPPVYCAPYDHDAAGEDSSTPSAAFVTPSSTFEDNSPDSPTAYVKRVYSGQYSDRDKGISQSDKTWRSTSAFHSSNPYASPWTIRNENGEYPRQQHLSRPPLSETNLKETQPPNGFVSTTHATRAFGPNTATAECEKRVQILRRSEPKMLYDHKSGRMVTVDPSDTGPKAAIQSANRRVKTLSYTPKTSQKQYSDRDKGISQSDKTWRSTSAFHSSNPYASPWTIRNENGEYPRQQHLSRPPLSETNLKETQPPNGFVSTTHATRAFGPNTATAECEKRVQILRRSEPKMLYDHKSGRMVTVDPSDTGPKAAIQSANRRVKTLSYTPKTSQKQVSLTMEREMDARKMENDALLARSTPRSSVSKIIASDHNFKVVKSKAKKAILTYRPISSGCNISKASSRVCGEEDEASEADKEGVNAKKLTVSEEKHEIASLLPSEAVYHKKRDDKATERSDKRSKSKKSLLFTKVQATRRKARKFDKMEVSRSSSVQEKKRRTRVSIQRTEEYGNHAPASLEAVRPKTRSGMDVDLLKRIPEGGGVVVLTDGQHGIDHSFEGIGEFETVKSRRTIHLERKMRREVACKPSGGGRTKKDGGIVVNVRSNLTRRVKRKGIPISVQSEPKQPKRLGRENLANVDRNSTTRTKLNEQGVQRESVNTIQKTEPMKKADSTSGARSEQKSKTKIGRSNEESSLESVDRGVKSVDVEGNARTSTKTSPDKTKKDRWRQKAVSSTSRDSSAASDRRGKEALQKRYAKKIDVTTIRKEEGDRNDSRILLPNPQLKHKSNRAVSRKPPVESKDRHSKDRLSKDCSHDGMSTKSTTKASSASFALSLGKNVPEDQSSVKKETVGTPPLTKLQAGASKRAESRKRAPNKPMKRVYVAKNKP